MKKIFNLKFDDKCLCNNFYCLHSSYICIIRIKIVRVLDFSINYFVLNDMKCLIPLLRSVSSLEVHTKANLQNNRIHI